nr:hypothetical protein CFP56_41357 [Quercus suber]
MCCSGSEPLNNACDQDHTPRGASGRARERRRTCDDIRPGITTWTEKERLWQNSVWRTIGYRVVCRKDIEESCCGSRGGVGGCAALRGPPTMALNVL